MRIKQISLVVVALVVALLALVTTLTVWAGDPDSPGGPTSDAAKMYTLEDIYDRLDTGAATAAITFTEPITGPEGTMHTLNEIYDLVGERAPVPKTGQTICYDASGSTINCEDTGQDGDLEKGVTWPNPRFTDNTDGTVTDTLTGLIWLKDAACMGSGTWSDALTQVGSLNSGANFHCGNYTAGTFSDWRLPNVREMQSLVHYGFFNPAVPDTAGTGQWLEGDPFTGVQSSFYWSSTTFANYSDVAWRVNLYYGRVDDGGKAGTFYVWPVRGGQ